MTPQELDVALKEIRRTRNLLVFLGFMPIMYLLVTGISIMMMSSGDVDFDMSMRIETMSWIIITLVVSVVLLFNIFRPNRYIIRLAKVGLKCYAIGFLLFFVYSVIILIDILGPIEIRPIEIRFIEKILLLVIGFAIYGGLATFIVNVKVDLYQKITHGLFYVILLLTIVGVDMPIGVTAISILAYPILSSYFAVKWAGKEFFAVMNGKNNEN